MIEQAVRRTGSGMPATIGRYRILGRLGKGAMGVVYSARDDQMERDVALKIMMADLESEPETRARFYREAQITSKLLHRNIITVFDMGEEDGRLYIVMELLKGQTLTEFLKNPERQTIEQKLDLMIQTCEGMAVAQPKGVVHRDLKPGNLFVQSDGALKILDFGVARLANSSMTASGLIVGTPDYMSPEQARGKEVDARSDIFSAAGVFYLMVTGRKPFEGSDLPVVLQKVVREDPLPIRDHEAPLPLVRIIMKALNKEPDRRYQRFVDMAADLVRFKRHFDTETRQIGTSARDLFDQLQQAFATVRERRAVLGLPPADDLDEQERAVRERYPFFCAGPDGAAPIVAPFRRSRLTVMLADLHAALDPVAAEATALGGALAVIEEGEQALAARDGRSAWLHFERATATAAESPRLVDGIAKARELFSEQQALEDRLHALVGEARAAEKSANWASVVGLCEQALAIQPQLSEALALASRARLALASEAEARMRRVGQLLVQFGKALQAGRLDDADRLLQRARETEPGSEEVKAAESRLCETRVAAAERDAQARRAAQEIAAARGVFQAGDRGAAIEHLDRFSREKPDAPGVVAELQRLRAEAARLAADEQRRAQAVAHAQEAESHWERGNLVEALKRAELALSLDRGQELAVRIQGLAHTKMREQAEAAARSAEAGARVAKAVELMAAGRFGKAAREAQRALELEPGRADAAGVLAEARRLEVEEEAARQREAAARQREKEIEKVLKTVRAALRSADYQRAAWGAENALRIDPDHGPAQQLLAQARAALAAAPVIDDPDGTVRLKPDGEPTFDPDDTAIIKRRVALKAVVTSVGDWASGLKRKLQSPRGQTTTEWLMIAGLFSAIGVFALRIVPTALKAFLWGLTSGIKSIAP